MIVTQADLYKAMANLEEKLKNQIKTKLSEEVSSEYVLLQDTLQWELKNVDVDYQVDEQAEELTATGQMVATSYLLRVDDLKLLTSDLYCAQLPDQYRLSSKEIQISKLNADLQEDGKVKVNLKASAQVIAEIESKQIVEQLKGQSVEYANNLLDMMEEIKYFRIFDEGKSRIPKFDFAIRVIVRAPTDAEEGSI